MINIQDVLQKNYVKDLVSRICGEEKELIARPASYMVRCMHENDRNIRRVIILPPRGFTADKMEQTNSHDEAEYATIEIKGAVREGKEGFSILKNCLAVASIPLSKATSELNKPYLLFDIGNPAPEVELKKHSAGTSAFAVVKSDGYGFYHNLINTTEDWLVLELYKKLRPQKPVDLAPRLQGLLRGEADALQSFYNAVVEYGDAVFSKKKNLIDNIVRMPVEKTLPALTEMLFAHDTGRHEACSVFAVILKIGKLHPDRVITLLRNAIEEGSAPTYYGEQLISKITLSSDKKAIQAA